MFWTLKRLINLEKPIGTSNSIFEMLMMFIIVFVSIVIPNGGAIQNAIVSNDTVSRRGEPHVKKVGRGINTEIPYINPPTVRPPPYTISSDTCSEMNVRENWIGNLCGDLNQGLVPQNPMGHQFLDGGVYPFEIIKNKSLEFFRTTLPILKADKSIPKVARYALHAEFEPPKLPKFRTKRAILQMEMELMAPKGRSLRQARSSRPRFCDNSGHYYHRLCKLYNAMWGKSPHSYPHSNERGPARNPGNFRPNRPPPDYNFNTPKPLLEHYHRPPKHPSVNAVLPKPYKTVVPKKLLQSETSSNNVNSVSVNELPPTPCPSSQEYLTPVFARNHEGAWRYVVQIPREGYFTQTVEITKCVKTECFYMEGSCKTSPRWQSLLVAELYYPEARFPTTEKPDTQSDNSVGNHETLQSSYTSDNNTSTNTTEAAPVKQQTKPDCDGFDDIGCYEVRLYYDWFLIPGSCKCWRRKFDLAHFHHSRQGSGRGLGSNRVIFRT